VQQDNKGVVELAVNRSQRMLGVGWHPEREVNRHTRKYILDLINKL
jgi:gamma-glutamyl-gamma-aminobutyrate hydrolase PuuD